MTWNWRSESSGTDMPSVPLMPDFCQGTHAFHHTIDSALDVLAAMGISSRRITISVAGAGAPAYWIVEQSPSAGDRLTADTEIALSIAGRGFFDALPSGMWESGGEAEPGTHEIVSVFDDPLQKAAHWMREGARFFDVRPDNPSACARWLSLFGIETSNWPEQDWYRLALVVPALHRLSGREEGIRFALRSLLELPLIGVRRRRSFTFLPIEQLSRLALRSSRLGRDFTLGNRLEDLESLRLVIGPVPLATYENFQTSPGAEKLNAVLGLCAPCYQTSRIDWLVDHLDRNPRLGIAEENACLGINSRIGAARELTA